MKKLIKITILCITLLIIFMMTYHVQAFTIWDLQGTPLNSDLATNAGNMAITIITTIGISASVITLIILGLKYMLGSVEEKATYKKSMMPYLIGAVLVFCASTVANIIYSIVINLGL